MSSYREGDQTSKVGAPPSADTTWAVIDTASGERVGTVQAGSGYAARAKAEMLTGKLRGEVDVQPLPVPNPTSFESGLIRRLKESCDLPSWVEIFVEKPARHLREEVPTTSGVVQTAEPVLEEERLLRFLQMVQPQLEAVPGDCRWLVGVTLPYLVRVMKGGGESYQSYHWIEVAGADDHLRHAVKHGERARWNREGKMPRDKSDNQPELAHQIVRLMMALAHHINTETEGGLLVGEHDHG